MLAQASEGMQARMKAVVLPPGRPTRERYKSMLLRREQLKAAIRLYFEASGISALAFPPTRIPPPKSVRKNSKSVASGCL